MISPGTSYCLEAMGLIGYATGRFITEIGIAPTLAIFGLPEAADWTNGAYLAARALGLVDTVGGEGQWDPEQGFVAMVDQIVASDADIVFVAAPFGLVDDLYAAANSDGLQASLWLSPGSTYDPSTASAPHASDLAASYLGSRFGSLWVEAGANPDLARALALTNPDLPLSDVLIEGWIAATIMEGVLRAAIESEDLSQAGVVEVAQNRGQVDLQGVGPQVQLGQGPDGPNREINVFGIDPLGVLGSDQPGTVAGGGVSGTVSVSSGYVGAGAAQYQFTGTCPAPPTTAPEG